MTAATTAKGGPRPVAGTIGLAFGGLWFLLGAASLPRGLHVPFEGVGVGVTAALIAVLWSRRASAGPSSGLFRRRGYLVAVALEVAAIYATSVLFHRFGLTGYLVQAVGVIVGLHFIGLWQATRLSSFLWIAGGMCAVSGLAACLPEALDGFSPRNAATGLGNALVLWLGAGRPVGPFRPRLAGGG